MRCPRCNNEIAAGAVVCEFCSEIIDPALSGDLEQRWGEPEDPIPAPPAARPSRPTGPQPRGRRGPARARPAITGPHQPRGRAPRITGPEQPPRQGGAVATPPEGRAAEPSGAIDRSVMTSAVGTQETPAPAPARPAFGGAAGQEQIKTMMLQADPEVERKTRIIDTSVPPVVKRAARAMAQQRERAPEEEGKRSLLDDLWLRLRHIYARMHRIDRLSSWALFACFIAPFLPWQVVRGEGMVSGIEGVGGLSALAALAAVGCVYARTERRRLAVLMTLLQLLITAAIAAVPLLRLLSATDRHFAFGVYVTVGLGGVAVLLTLARLARISS